MRTKITTQEKFAGKGAHPAGSADADAQKRGGAERLHPVQANEDGVLPC